MKLDPKFGELSRRLWYKLAKMISRSQKLFLFGRYSLALLLPKKWLTELGAKREELVTINFDRRKGRIILRFKQNPDQSVAPVKLKAAKTKAQKTTTDLQPIPEL